MILKDLVDMVAQKLQDSTAETRDEIKQWILDAKTDMMHQHPFECMRQEHEITADGSDQYVLPVDFEAVWKLKIGAVTVPNHYSNVANDLYYKVVNGLTVGSKVKVLSSSANDTTELVSIRDNDGVHEEVTLNGSADVETAGSFDEVNSVSKEETEGQVTVKDAADTELFILPRFLLSWHIRTLKFNADVESGTAISLVYLRRIRKLTDDYDTDELQLSWHNVIYRYCLMRGCEWQDNISEYPKSFELYNGELVKAIRKDNRERNRNAALTFQVRDRI